MKLNSIYFKSLYIKLVFIFRKAFLPHGYPHTVSADYLQYQLWDSVQAFASSLMNNLATQAIFKGVGVGDANATVLAATITWLLKDGTSIIGSLVFATMQSTKMDSYCKRWRLFADMLNDLAISIDLLSPALARPYFTAIQCCSGVLRSLVGIAGGATRAALTQHQAKCNNLADVSAKDNSQERIVNLLALLFSLLLIPLVSDHSRLIWTLFTVFTILHIYANYRAVKVVCIDVFNANRLAQFMEHFVQQKMAQTNKESSDKSEHNVKVQYSVEYINQRENVWCFMAPFERYDKYFANVRISYLDIAINQQPLPCSTGARHLSTYRDPAKRFLIVASTTKNSALFFEVFILTNAIDPTASHLQRNSFEHCQLLVEILLIIFIVQYVQQLSNSEADDLTNMDQDVFLASRTRINLDNLSMLSKNILALMQQHNWKLDHLLLFELYNDDMTSNVFNCEYNCEDNLVIKKAQ